MRRAKIVATIGPASESREMVQALVDSGIDVARINASHGTHAEHEIVYRNVRSAAAAAGRAVAVILDLQGPKIRLETFKNGAVVLSPGDKFTITIDEVEGDETICGCTFKGLPADCKPGDRLLIDDGRIEIRVVKVDDRKVETQVEVGGPVSDHKGINLPGVAVSVPAISEKDKEDLRWGLGLGVDVIALSFVRSVEDAEEIRALMREYGREVPVIAKIEKPQAVEVLDDLIVAFDGFMVARGDLGVELPLEEVPMVQKRAIALARQKAKPVIVATQVLDSMITNPRPTRAEVSDCANAILDGADAVMLSGETSVGAHPVETVETMARIIEAVESKGIEKIPPLMRMPWTRNGVLSQIAVETGERLGCKYLVAYTSSGDTARRMARMRSRIPILALTPQKDTRNCLAFSWGVQVNTVDQVEHTDEMVAQIDHLLRERKIAEDGDRVVIVSGVPFGRSGSTNSIRVHKMGEIYRE